MKPCKNILPKDEDQPALIQGEGQLNRVARSAVEAVRSNHPDYVFTYKGHPEQNINNSSWKRVHKAVGLPLVRLHDLKHTFGRRLRAAGVLLDTRKVLLGHRNGDITTPY